jgi:hypothetical protein
LGSYATVPSSATVPSYAKAQLRVERARSREALAPSAQVRLSSSCSDPMLSLESQHIATTPATAATSFHFSKSDSLQPPDPLDLLPSLYFSKISTLASNGWLSNSLRR